MNKKDVYGLIYNKEFNDLSGKVDVTLNLKDDFIRTISFDASMSKEEKCKVKIIIVINFIKNPYIIEFFLYV